jgi:hypothetical protein
MDYLKISKSDILKGGDLGGYGNCFIYFLMFDNKITYIGQTINIDGRKKQHIKAGKIFDKISFVHVIEEELNNVEAKLIARFTPPANKTMPPNDYYVSNHTILKSITDEFRGLFNELSDFELNNINYVTNVKSQLIKKTIIKALKSLQ